MKFKVSPLRLVGMAVLWTVILASAGAILAAVLVPRIAGATPYTVLTSSMEPRHPPGTLVVVRPTAVENIGVGSIITYQLRSGEPTVVTHRVVGKSVPTTDGEVRFITRGDANAVPDAEPVRPEQVRGKLWYSIPYLGYVNQALSGSQRQTATYVVAGGLLTYALWMVLTSRRHERRTSKGVSS